ncbi:DUF3611 family protein [Tolypothrix bouteillei VB521301_2]
MQNTLEDNTVHPKLEKIANILRLVGWTSLCAQLALGAAAGLMVIFAISGRNFNQTLTPPTPGVGVNTYNPGITPGIGAGIFWAVCGNLTLLFTLYLAFRITRFAKRLRNPNIELHPKKAEVMQLLKIAVIAASAGMLLFIIGGASALGLLLAKSIAQPQGVAIYDPARIIRSLDIFVAMANMSGIIAHFVGTIASVGLFIWLHPEL